MKYNYEILNQLNKYKGKDKNRLHVPGHKNVGWFKSRFPVSPIDVTELSFSDDLSCPTGVIKKAQEDIAEILGAKKAYITTDGSSSGVLAMMFVASAYGNKIIVPRNSHKSVFNACRLLNIEPVIVQGEEDDGILQPPAAELIETLIVNDVNISGMIIASPDYYGIVPPIDDYAEILKRYDRHLFIDGAHGSNLMFGKYREAYAGTYADMWVDGCHKGLPTLTQGAVVCVNEDALIPRAEEALNIFRTTSPSYPIMASVEYGIKYFENNPKELSKAQTLIGEFKQSMQGITFYDSIDWSKLVMDFKPLGISPYLAQEFLEKRGIYAEMNDGRYLLFYLSPCIEADNLKELKAALMNLVAQKKYKGTYKDVPPVPSQERTYSFLYAHKNKAEWVPLAEAEGRMCAENAGITPPCLPVVIAGEIVTEQVIAALSASKNTFGLLNGKIKVVKI